LILRKYKSIIKDEMDRALKEINFPEVDYQIKENTNPEYGELYTNIPFMLSKSLKKNPMDIANEIQKELVFDQSIISEVSKPGYVNFKINYKYLCEETLRNEITQLKESVNIGENQKVILEHTSVNPNKALHIGHARNLFIGDTLARMLRFTGYNLTVMNYIDDSGLQVADIIVGMKYGGFSEIPENNMKFDEYAGDKIYVKINELYENDKELAGKREYVLKELEKKSEIRQYAKEITNKILKAQLETAKRLDAKYDLLVFESDIIFSNGWKIILDKLKEEKIIQLEKEGDLSGAWIFKTNFKNETDKVIIRSDGTSTYIAKDIVLAAWKIGIINEIFNYLPFNNTELLATTLDNIENKYNFHNNMKSITLIDARQSRLQKIIKEILNQFNDNKDKIYEHLSYEIVSLSKGTAETLGIRTEDKKIIQMSGRKGMYINVDKALDIIKNKVYEETKLRNINESEEWIDNTAEKISIAAFRYELLKNDLDKIIVFDLNNSLKLDGETGPYLLYTFARATSILEKSEFQPKIEQIKNINECLNQPHEIELIKNMAKIDIIIEESVKNMSPMRIAKFTYNLCNLFNSFYEKSPVLREEDKNIMNSRLFLVNSFRNSLKILFDLLGINYLDRI
tara:strand:- start:6834 stop:8714 length:1881 start_codon:yes stop_codon:yes gene_type:complete